MRKLIIGFSKFSVDEHGVVYGARGKPLAPHINKGMLAVKIFNDAGARIAMPLHRIVANAFVGCTDGLRVRHIDGNIENNSASNLEIYDHRSTIEQKKKLAAARNKKYVENGGDRVATLRKNGSDRYRQKLKTDPRYANKASQITKDARRRSLVWYEKNKDSKKDILKLRRQLWEKSNRHKATAKTQRRNAQKLKAMPSWADKKEIDRIYFIARRVSEVTGILHHVDHIVPLRNTNVCGLHIHQNLRVVAFDVNCSKSNKYGD